jgi:hypothetical protein
MTLQRAFVIMLLSGAWIMAGVANGSINKPLNPVGAFASILMVLMAIAVGVMK